MMKILNRFLETVLAFLAALMVAGCFESMKKSL